MQRIYWPTTLFLIITPIVVFIGLPVYFVMEGVPVGILIFTLIFAALTNLSITAGYHRLWAHKSYEAHPIVKAVFLLIGASGWQGSAMKWSSDHRQHHAKVDGEEDPYSISKGFWYAHMGWLFFKDSVDRPVLAPDLKKDWMLDIQDRYYIPIAIVMSFGVPTVVGLFFGAPWAGFLIGGAFRVIATQQSTFLVNSLAHTLGKKTYNDQVSARDSIFVALLTHGEGYHNFHHTFQWDYRNGVRWYHWDPTKWTIQTLAAVGLAKKLRRISEAEILRARLRMEEMKLKSRGYSEDKLESFRNRILAAQEAMQQLREDLAKLREEMSYQSHLKYEKIMADFKQARHEFKFVRRQWKRMLSGYTAY